MPGLSRWYSAQMDEQVPPGQHRYVGYTASPETPLSPTTGRGSSHTASRPPNEPSTYSESSTGRSVNNEPGLYAQQAIADQSIPNQLDPSSIPGNLKHGINSAHEQFADCHSSSHDMSPPPPLVETTSLNFCANDERLPLKMRIMDILDSSKAHFSCFQDWIAGTLWRSHPKLTSDLARSEIEYQDLFRNSSGALRGDLSQSWCRRHWKLLLALTVVTVVFLAVGLTVVLAIIVPRQIEKLLRTSVLITESTEITNPRGSQFTVIVKGQLISGSSVKANISPGDTAISVRQIVQRKTHSEAAEYTLRRLVEINSTDHEGAISDKDSATREDWWDPFTFVKPSDRIEELGTIEFEPFTVLGQDQEIVGHLDIKNRGQFSSCVKDAIKGQSAYWLLSGSTNVHVAGLTFQSIPFNRVFKLTPPSPLDASHVVVTSVDLMEDPAVAGSISSEKQTSNMPILIEGHVLNTGNLEISDFGSASFELKYLDTSIGTLHTPHLGFLHGINPLRLRGYLLPGKELQQIFSNYLHGASNVLTITINAVEENVLQSAIKGLTITQTLPLRPESSGSVISHMFLEKVQLSPSVTRSQSSMDAYNRVMLDDGSLSRERFPTWPQGLVLMTPTKEERRMLKQRVRRYRRLLKEDGIKIRKKEARQTVWRDMQKTASEEDEVESVPDIAETTTQPPQKTYPVDLHPYAAEPAFIVRSSPDMIPQPQSSIRIGAVWGSGGPVNMPEESFEFDQGAWDPRIIGGRNNLGYFPDPMSRMDHTDDLRFIEEFYSDYEPGLDWPLSQSWPPRYRPEFIPLDRPNSLEIMDPDFYRLPHYDWDVREAQRLDQLQAAGWPGSAAALGGSNSYLGRHRRFLQELDTEIGRSESLPVSNNGLTDTPINSILSTVVNVVGNTIGRARAQANSPTGEYEQSVDGQQNGNVGNNLSFLGDLSKVISSTVLQAVRGGANQGLKTAADLGDMLNSRSAFESNSMDEGESGGISITNIGVIKWSEPVSVLIQRAFAGMGSSLPIETKVIVGFWSPFYESRLVETQITGELVFNFGSKTFEGNSMIATGKPETIRKGTDQYTCEKNLRLHGSKQSSEVTDPHASLISHSDFPANTDDGFTLGAVTQMGIIKGQYMMERINLQSSLSIQPEQLSVLGSQMLEAHQMGLELRDMDMSARVMLNREEFEVYENNRTQRLDFGGKPLEAMEPAMDLRIRRLSIPASATELTIVVELSITLNLPIEIEVESPIYLNWMSQDVVGGPLTIPRLKLRRGPNDVIAYVGFYKDRLAQLVLPMALQMYREGTFSVCLTSRSADEISDEEYQVQQKTASVFADALNIMLAGLVSYCTRVPLGKSETRMLGDVFLPFVTQLTKTIHV